MRRVGFGPDQVGARAELAADQIEAAGTPRLVAIGAIGAMAARGVDDDVAAFLEAVVHVLVRRMVARGELNLPPSARGTAVVQMAVETLTACGVTLDQSNNVWIDAPPAPARVLRLVVDNAPRGGAA